MNLMEQWRSVAYNEATGKEKLQQLWAAYFQEEKEMYLTQQETIEEFTNNMTERRAEILSSYE